MITRIQIMKLLTPTKENERNENWRAMLASMIECNLEYEIKLKLEFFDDCDEEDLQESDLIEALENITEICILVGAAVELSTDMNKRAALYYNSMFDLVDHEILPIADICMEMYGVLRSWKCKEYADIILAGESMFSTK